MKIKYRYKETTPGNIVIYSRTSLTPWKWYGFRKYDTRTSSADEAFGTYLRGVPHTAPAAGVLEYWTGAAADFLRSLKPWTWVSTPGTIYRQASDIFKKLPLVVSFGRDVPYLRDIEFRELKWYNLVHLYVSDMDWKYKWRSYRFVSPPTVAVTFFGRWTLRFQRTAGVIDDLYWEDMMEYLWGGMPRKNIGLAVLKSYYGDTEDIYTINNYLK